MGDVRQGIDNRFSVSVVIVGVRQQGSEYWPGAENGIRPGKTEAEKADEAGNDSEAAATVARKYKYTFPESHHCCPPPAAPSRHRPRSASSLLVRAFLTICRAPLAVVPGHAEYMSASVGLAIGAGTGKEW